MRPATKLDPIAFGRVGNALSHNSWQKTQQRNAPLYNIYNINNTINYSKNNNTYNTNNTIFYVNTFNYNKKNIYNTNNKIYNIINNKI
jgi:hypothetical protein